MASRQHAASDIVPGSIWPGRCGGHATVITSAAGYVEFERADGTRGRVYHEHFRADFISPYDSRNLRSQFAMCVANLESFHAFWSPSAQRLLARSSVVPPEDCRGAARGRPALPEDARYVGTYCASDTQPTKRWKERAIKLADRFFEDLNDHLARISGPHAAA
jgi:hypothetical protein